VPLLLSKIKIMPEQFFVKYPGQIFVPVTVESSVEVTVASVFRMSWPVGGRISLMQTSL